MPEVSNDAGDHPAIPDETGLTSGFSGFNEIQAIWGRFDP
jgi:hypothetical protein